MIKLYNWLICKFFKKCELDIPQPKETYFERYCKDNPWARECRIYED